MPVLYKIVRFPARFLMALLALTISISIVRGANQGRPNTNPFMRIRQFRVGRISIEVGSPALGLNKN